MGYKTPPVEHQFKKGVASNPTGMSKETARRIRENAAKATEIRERLLSAVLLATQEGASIEYVEAALLKLLKDSEDRGLGAPVQKLGGEGENGRIVIERHIIHEKHEAPDQD